MGKVTVTPSGHFGKAPSEQGATFQGQEQTQVEQRRQRAEVSAPPCLTDLAQEVCALIYGEELGRGNQEKRQVGIS